MDTLKTLRKHSREAQRRSSVLVRGQHAGVQVIDLPPRVAARLRGGGGGGSDTRVMGMDINGIYCNTRRFEKRKSMMCARSAKVPRELNIYPDFRERDSEWMEKAESESSVQHESARRSVDSVVLCCGTSRKDHWMRVSGTAQSGVVHWKVTVPSADLYQLKRKVSPRSRSETSAGHRDTSASRTGVLSNSLRTAGSGFGFSHWESTDMERSSRMRHQAPWCAVVESQMTDVGSESRQQEGQKFVAHGHRQGLVHCGGIEFHPEISQTGEMRNGLRIIVPIVEVALQLEAAEAFGMEERDPRLHSILVGRIVFDAESGQSQGMGF
ncbi:hypothetical protein GGX14DRAFT_607979 [Mycena pura]|uniref:Uncharacterized protein n=1 Tax=Mycena pura TaxID=153505 RepID=A0AAD6Y394_9AGAR|nr:hypothetical protein GGX14DRAFT_607979 [Mycena pura]